MELVRHSECLTSIKNQHRPRSVARKHHQRQHDQEEETRIQKEAERGRTAGGTRQGPQETAQHPVDDLEGLWIRHQEKHERRVKTILGFESDVHRRIFLVLRRGFFAPPLLVCERSV